MFVIISISIFSFVYSRQLYDLISVEDLLELIDKYDLNVIREECVQFLLNSNANQLFKFRIADKYGLAEVEVKIRFVIVADCHETVHFFDLAFFDNKKSSIDWTKWEYL